MEQISEAEISMILDTYMYLDYQQAAEGSSIREILTELEKYPEYQEGGSHFGEYTVLKQAALNDAVGELTIGCQSTGMGYDRGTAACTFSAPDKSTVYVVYRGTGDGEWQDNGIGMTQEMTTQQERALQYFEEAVEAMGVGEEQRLVVTGHSKGGNKAQFVTMETQYADKVDACYSVDGQGFSQKAIRRWQNKYGKEEFEERRQKIQGIHGENDYVSALGICIIAAENIRYVRSPVDKSNFAGYHDIKYLFAEQKSDPAGGETITSFKGRKNPDAPGRGTLGEYAAALSSWVMRLPEKARDGCAAVIMQVMESMEGTKDGINGEKLTFFDLLDFTFLGIPLLGNSLFTGEKGRNLLGGILKKESFTGQLQGNVNLEISREALISGGGELEQASCRLLDLTGQVKETAGEIPSYMKGGVELYCQMRVSAETLENLEKKLRQAVQVQQEIERNYRRWEEQAMEIAMEAIDVSRQIQ
ncbi:MAG: DUF2974 domain-containing protein [Lachnospiraceae bacterium]|nr:DUF2974 domain-containing protein [Lachnospiraceae bacterium]